MREIKFRAVVYSEGLDKFFVSDGLTIDSGLACLFGFENDGLKQFDDVVLTSKKFVEEIQEDWWERDWCHVGNLQDTGLKDKNCKEIYEGDIIEIKNVWTNGVGKWSHFVGKIVFFECEFQAKDINDNYLSLHRYKSRIKVIGNIYENPELLKSTP